MRRLGVALAVVALVAGGSLLARYGCAPSTPKHAQLDTLQTRLDAQRDSAFRGIDSTGAASQVRQRLEDSLATLTATVQQDSARDAQDDHQTRQALAAARQSRDSIARLLQLDSISQRRLWRAYSDAARERQRRANMMTDRDAWRDRAGILGHQVAQLHQTGSQAVTIGQSGCSLNLGLLTIPRPVGGAGLGATAGLASNRHGTDLGGAVGLTVAILIPFHRNC